jgi:hypothetical protein
MNAFFRRMICNVKATGTYSYHYDFKVYEINYFRFDTELNAEK